MAEGFGKNLKGDKYNFFSAGTKKHGLNPLAVKVMGEAGVDISNQTSNTLDEFDDIKMDIIFTVCSDANENCPYYPHGKIIHMGFDDPPRLTKDLEDEKEILDIYRRVRDEIKGFVEKIESYI
ncbi:MAG: arsenate reductase ArsC [Bacteriovoracaceae bacterium]